MIVLDNIKYITESTDEDLKDASYVENLMLKLGFNTEALNEQPSIVKNHTGGLHIWQYPNQFSKYITFLKDFDIHSYIEVGCRWGGTFVLTNEYLKRFCSIKKSIAVDLIDSPVAQYCNSNQNTSFIKMNSHSQEFKDYMKENKFDVIFIDGDHSYEGVSQDYEFCKNSGNIYVFHDVINDVCPGVVQFWNELKNDDQFIFHEFIEQYPEVLQETGQSYLGIGVAIRKNPIQLD